MQVIHLPQFKLGGNDLNKKETNKADGQTDKNRQSSFSSQSLFQTFHFMCDSPYLTSNVWKLPLPRNCKLAIS